MEGLPQIGDVFCSRDAWGLRWQVIGVKSDLQGVYHVIIETPETLERRTLALETLRNPQRFLPAPSEL